MSVQLNPDIDRLDPQSLRCSIYTQLYQNFFNAQDRKGAEHPFGIVEGDATSVRLHNTAYDFASAIAGSVAGSGSGDGGVLTGYLKKSGGDMVGLLRANYGFEAGIGNTRVLETYSQEIADDDGAVIRTDYGVAITGDLRVGGSNLLLDGHAAVRFNKAEGTLSLDASHLDLGSSIVTSTGELILGADKAQGLYLCSSKLQLHGQDVYHTGTANLPTVDWTMHNGTVEGDLSVAGISVHTGMLRALHGVELGAEGRPVAVILQEELALSGNLSFGTGYGIRIGGRDVLIRSGEQDILLCGIGGDLLLGSDATAKIRLQTGIADTDGEHLLLSKYGAAYFPASLTVRHNYGAELLSSYRVDDSDEGIVIHKRLRFGAADGCFLTGTPNSLDFTSRAEHISDEGIQYTEHATRFGHRPSTSAYAPQNRISDSFFLSTDGDFVTVDTPLEAHGHLGIDGSRTRLAGGRLDFTQGHYLLDVADGIKHFGTAYFTGPVTSEYFASGFAGAGWAVQANRTTGMIVATFDELVVRRRMRVYEMEVQRTAVTNGSMWVSDFCSGDYVEEL